MSPRPDVIRDERYRCSGPPAGRIPPLRTPYTATKKPDNSAAPMLPPSAKKKKLKSESTSRRGLSQSGTSSSDCFAIFLTGEKNRYEKLLFGSRMRIYILKTFSLEGPRYQMRWVVAASGRKPGTKVF